MSLKRLRLHNPYFALLRVAWKYAQGERLKYLKVYGLFVMSNILDSLMPILWGVFINEIQKQGMGILNSAWIYAGVYLLIHFLDWSCHGPARVYERQLAFNMARNFMQELYHKALHLPIKWHQDSHSGATINRIRKAYEALDNFFSSGFRYIHSFGKFSFSLIAMIYFSPLFGAVAVGIGIAIVYIILRFDKPFIAASKEVNEREHVVSSTLFDSLSNIITVITLRLERRMEKGLMEKVHNVYPPFDKKIKVNEWKWFTVDMCVSVMYVILLVGYIYQNWIPGEVFLIGGLVALMGYADRFASVFHDIAWLYTQIVTYHTDITTAQNILDAYAKHHLPDAERRLPGNWERIKVDQLHFKYESQKVDGFQSPGLQNLSFLVERRKRIALIGESGSGKSTLLTLLRGLYEVDERTTVLVDGKAQDRLSILANDVTLFPQEPEIFENTIEYNITLGLTFEKEEVERVCKVACFKEVVAHLPKGLESSIKEKGVNLSGGQKQRLALARGILAAKDSTIVLMDEPTSSVDPKTEMDIYDSLFEEFSDKAVISSLHRLHLLSKFDYVYVLDKGKIVDEGTFEQLKQESPVFQELWRHQEEAMLLKVN